MDAAPVAVGEGATDVVLFQRAPRRTRPVLDSLARAEILACLGPQGFQLRTFRSGMILGHDSRPEPRGLRIAVEGRTGTQARFVAWEDVREVGYLDMHARRADQAFERGAQIGALVGLVALLLLVPPPDDLGALFYPIAIVVGVLPFWLLGGLIGMAHPGLVTEYVHCWP